MEGAELYEYGVVEDDVDEGKMTTASVLTEVTVTVAAFDDDEPASDDWEEHRADRDSTTSREVSAIFGACSRRPDVSTKSLWAERKNWDGLRQQRADPKGRVGATSHSVKDIQEILQSKRMDPTI